MFKEMDILAAVFKVFFSSIRLTGVAIGTIVTFGSSLLSFVML